MPKSKLRFPALLAAGIVPILLAAVGDLAGEDQRAVALLPSSERNEASTPPYSVLPSTPAITRKVSRPDEFRDLVIRAQLALHTRGYEVGKVDGELHARATAALFRFQTENGLVPDGRLNSEVLSALGIVAQ